MSINLFRERGNKIGRETERKQTHKQKETELGIRRNIKSLASLL
jgi:hypothetical protein